MTDLGTPRIPADARDQTGSGTCTKGARWEPSGTPWSPRERSGLAGVPEPGAGSPERRPASAPRPWERRGCGAEDHWRRRAAAAVRAGDHSSAQAAPVLRASGASSSLRAGRIARAVSHRDLPLALQVSVSRPRGGYPVLAARPGGIVRVQRAEDPGDNAGGQPQPQAPKASPSPEAPQLGSAEARMAKSVPSAVRVVGGTGVTVPAHRPPSLPAAARESGFLVHAFPSAPLLRPPRQFFIPLCPHLDARTPMPAGWVWKSGPGGLM